MRHRTLLAVLVAAVLAVHAVEPVLARQGAGTAAAPALSAAETAAAARVRVESVREVTTALAAPDMEGRATATPGGERAARYIAARMEKLGLAPLGDAGTYLQAIKFKSWQILPDSSVSAGGERLAPREHFAYVTAPPADAVDASGGLVFVAYGVTSEELGRDDLAGIDVKGKVVVLLAGKPDTVAAEAWRKAVGQQSGMARIVQAGAAAVVYSGVDSPKQPFATLADYFTRRRVTLAEPAGMSLKVPLVLVNDAGMERLVAGSGTTWAALKSGAARGEKVSRDLGRTADVKLRFERSEGVGSNVAGVLEGSDPELKKQAVVYTAHYDAYGKGRDGRIYHGAADNALGVGMILSIAEAFAKLPERPRRSIVILAVTGEEYGLYGSQYWVAHPTWPLENVVANLNFDGMGTEVYGPVRGVLGLGAEHSDLGAVFQSVLAASGLSAAKDPMPEENLFQRSDHFPFVKRGVPAMSFIGVPEGDAWVARVKHWLETDYHQPEDNITPEWHWDGPRTLAATGFLIGLRVASADAAPAWLPTSPFKKG